eukprot:8019111-Pyramimonas_sp.AAC.2
MHLRSVGTGPARGMHVRGTGSAPRRLQHCIPEVAPRAVLQIECAADLVPAVWGPQPGSILCHRTPWAGRRELSALRRARARTTCHIIVRQRKYYSGACVLHQSPAVPMS